MGLKVVHLNVRLNEGGAARVALGLHLHHLGVGEKSLFFLWVWPRRQTFSIRIANSGSKAIGRQKRYVDEFLHA